MNHLSITPGVRGRKGGSLAVAAVIAGMAMLLLASGMQTPLLAATPVDRAVVASTPGAAQVFLPHVPRQATPTPTPTSWIELVGQIGGVIMAVDVQGSYAYVGVGPRLVILNVSDPAHPVLVGQSPALPALVQGVSVVGSLAYVADGSSGLQIIEVSNPANPILRGAYDTPRFAVGVSVTGSLAYVADGASLQIIEASNPANPFLLGAYDTLGEAVGVSVVGSLAYVADEWDGLQIIDVSDPANPLLLGEYSAP
ncbi:MAG: hypothetical protein WAW26_11110, partial [Anaerolineae bacterium]